MIELSGELLAALVSHAHHEAPYEACGWLAGKGAKVERIYPVANVAGDRRRAFVMEPEAQLRSMREIRGSGLELVGTYHSHPITPPRPSVKDRLLALYPDSAHLIVSLAGAEPEVRCYRITEEGNHSVELCIS